MAEKRDEGLGRGPDPIQIGEQIHGTLGCGARVQGVGGRRRCPFEWWGQHVARGGEVRRAGATGRRRQKLVQERQELPRIGEQVREVGSERGRASVGGILQQHLGVADDVVQRRAQLMTKLRGGIDGHAPGVRPEQRLDLPEQAGSSTGLVS